MSKAQAKASSIRVTHPSDGSAQPEAVKAEKAATEAQQAGRRRNYSAGGPVGAIHERIIANLEGDLEIHASYGAVSLTHRAEAFVSAVFGYLCLMMTLAALAYLIA